MTHDEVKEAILDVCQEAQTIAQRAKLGGPATQDDLADFALCVDDALVKLFELVTGEKVRA